MSGTSMWLELLRLNLLTAAAAIFILWPFSIPSKSFQKISIARVQSADKHLLMNARSWKGFSPKTDFICVKKIASVAMKSESFPVTTQLILSYPQMQRVQYRAFVDHLLGTVQLVLLPILCHESSIQIRIRTSWEVKIHFQRMQILSLICHVTSCCVFSCAWCLFVGRMFSKC